MQKKIFVFTILTIAITATVWHRAFADTNVQPNSPQEPNAFCPDISVMQKDSVKGNWTAQTSQGLWKSYDMSFATDITQFVGAQWQGENVGQITCVYNSEQHFNLQGQPTVQPTLPVLMVFHTLTFQPTEGQWKHITSVGHGVYNCRPLKNAQQDCPFKINIKPPLGNIVQEAESLKSNTDNSGLIQPPAE